jgi:hypothetical protein
VVNLGLLLMLFLIIDKGRFKGLCCMYIYRLTSYFPCQIDLWFWLNLQFILLNPLSDLDESLLGFWPSIRNRVLSIIVPTIICSLLTSNYCNHVFFIILTILFKWHQFLLCNRQASVGRMETATMMMDEIETRW